MANLVIPRRGIWTQQPQGPTSTQEIFGYQVGEVVCPTVALHKISGGISVAARASGLAFVGDSVDSCASRSLTRPFVVGTDTELTFVCVFRRQGTAQTGSAIAGLGATGGESGNTLFRITGGDTAANIKFQVQDSNGSIFYNVDSSGVTVNDQKTHTAVITLSTTVLTGTLEFLIDGKTAGSASIADGTPVATTFNATTACASIRGGAVISAGDADVTLAYPIFGKVSQAQAISLSLNPWQIFAPRETRLFVPVSAGGPTAYALYSQPGSVAVTGSASTLQAFRKLSANPGTVSIVGASATCKVSRKLNAAVGAVTIAWATAELVYTPVGASPVLNAEAGSVTIAGAAATLKASRKLAADAGSITIDGATATMVRYFAGQSIDAQPGSITIAGADAGYHRQYKIDASPFDVNIAGASAGLIYTAAAGVMTLTQADLDAVVAAVIAALNATAIPVNVQKMNSAEVIGDGTEAQPWRGFGVSP